MKTWFRIDTESWKGSLLLAAAIQLLVYILLIVVTGAVIFFILGSEQLQEYSISFTRPFRLTVVLLTSTVGCLALFCGIRLWAENRVLAIASFAGFLTALAVCFSWEFAALLDWLRQRPIAGPVASILPQLALATICIWCLVPTSFLGTSDGTRQRWYLLLVASGFFIFRFLLACLAWFIASFYFYSPRGELIRGSNDRLLLESSIEIQGPAGEKWKIVAGDLDGPIVEATSLVQTLRYAFVEGVPTADSITYAAFVNSFLDRLHEPKDATERNGASRLAIEQEQRLIDALRLNNDYFRAVSNHVEQETSVQRRLLLIVDAIAGRSYGIHLTIYLLFAYAVLLLRIPPVHESKTPLQQISIATDNGLPEKITFLKDAIVQLGFVGTLLGLSQAIVELGKRDIVREILEQPGLSPSLAANLGLAFNTTLVALLLSVLLGLIFAVLASSSPYHRLLAAQLRNSPCDPSSATKDKSGDA
ncbi:MAG: hypothetical protein KDB22_11840 [Planctomycetales bacterium]|nr:hypothetical protein [Planctomycetales bacterium]